MKAAVIGTFSGEVSARPALRSARGGVGRLGAVAGVVFATMARRPVSGPGPRVAGEDDKAASREN
jgi:hypothetical protein